MAVTTDSGVPTWNFTIKQSADWSPSLAWTDDNGNPVNLSGCSMKLMIKAYATSSVSLLTLSSSASSGSRIVLGGTTGIYTLVFAHADTAALPVSGAPTPNLLQSGLPAVALGVYDLQFIDVNGDVGYLFKGNVSIEPSVTE
jgi:hypothetical protein